MGNTHIVTLRILISFSLFSNCVVVNGHSNDDDREDGDSLRNNHSAEVGRTVHGFRVIGGKEADLDEFPWQAAINKVGTRKDYGTFCGGTLINERYILSAAHCFVEIPTGPKDPKSIEVLLRIHNRRSTDNKEDTVRLAVDEIIVHPKYTTFEIVGQESFPPLDNDIALLRLAHRVEFSNHKRKSPSPLCLRSDNFTMTEGDVGLAAGWGLADKNDKFGSNILKKVDLKLASNVDCYTFFIMSFGPENSVKAERFICTKGVKDSEGIAQGDSGGFLISKDENGYRQIGVTSMTQYKPKGGVEFSTFFNVDLRRNWILKEVNKRDPYLQTICT